jgi:uncharacterized protein (TIGR03083 family)
VTRVEHIPRIGEGEGDALLKVQYERFADVLDALTPDEWALPTDCPGWSVHDVAAHVLGGMAGRTTLSELLRQVRGGRRLARAERIRDPLDAMNAYHVAAFASVPGPELAARIREVAPRALGTPGLFPLTLRTLVRPRLAVAGRVSFGWILDVVYTRDTFLHRVDVCRATGREPLVDDTEGRIVADVVREWVGRHGEAVTVRLRGGAGGTYEAGSRGPVLELDAVEFARLVSGRGAPVGLLATSVQY